MLKALEEENVNIDIISETSSGSIVAALYAAGYTPEDIYLFFKKYAKSATKFNVGNIFKLIYGILFKRKIIITGLNNGNYLEKIIDIKTLKTTQKNSKMVVDMFFTVYEDITAYAEIKEPVELE